MLTVMLCLRDVGLGFSGVGRGVSHRSNVCSPHPHPHYQSTPQSAASRLNPARLTHHLFVNLLLNISALFWFGSVMMGMEAINDGFRDFMWS